MQVGRIKEEIIENKEKSGPKNGLFLGLDVYILYLLPQYMVSTKHITQN